jgi:hypothetical protein
MKALIIFLEELNKLRIANLRAENRIDDWKSRSMYKNVCALDRLLNMTGKLVCFCLFVRYVLKGQFSLKS